MTILKARQILGKAGEQLSDTQIEEIIGTFDTLIEIGFQQFEEGEKASQNEKNVE